MVLGFKAEHFKKSKKHAKRWRAENIGKSEYDS